MAPADILVQLAAFSPTVQPDSAYTLEPRHLVAAKNDIIFSLDFDLQSMTV